MNSKQILIVDNSDSLLHLYERQFRLLLPDFQIVTARNGFSALDKIQDQSFELLIVDHDLPDMSGLELIHEANRLLPDSHILLMAVNNVEKIEAAARRYRLRVDACLDKIPFLMQLWECEGRQYEYYRQYLVQD